MPRKAVSLLTFLILASTLTVSADSRRRAVNPSSSAQQNDALGIGHISGAAVSGTVAAVSGTTIVLNSGGASPIVVDASSARFATLQSATASLENVEPGARIIAFISTSPAPQPGVPLRAQWILVESAADLNVTATIDSINSGASSFMVLGISIHVDGNTTYSTAFPTFAPVTSLADLAPGQVVAVSASFAGSLIVADHIHVLAPQMQQYTMLSGNVKSIGSTSWTLTRREGGDVDVRVDANTRIIGEPRVGDPVQVMAKVGEGGTYLAVAIMRLPEGPSMPDVRVEARGTVKSIGPTEWIVASSRADGTDLRVRITSETLIYPNPRIGDRVIIIGRRDSSGTFTALLIGRWF
ncbi:MAG TPA: DUF5666 domain-containing protein [Thermoanaerobaculia bacterium]